MTGAMDSASSADCRFKALRVILAANLTVSRRVLNRDGKNGTLTILFASAVARGPALIDHDTPAAPNCESNRCRNQENVLDINDPFLLITYPRKACV